MAQIADSLLMNLYSNEPVDDDHDSSETTSSIIRLLENGAINDETIVGLLLSHHRHPNKHQEKQAVRMLANLCFNRLQTFRALNDQIDTEKNDLGEFIELFCIEFCKLAS